MATVTLEPGQLPPPACYGSEQDRFEAYVHAIVGTITGEIQWVASSSAPGPTQLENYWLKLDSNGKPINILKWSTYDGGKWVPVLNIPNWTNTTTQTTTNYQLTFDPAYGSLSAYEPGRRYTFVATIANSGPATIQVDGHGAIPIKRRGQPLKANDILVGMVVDGITDGSAFHIQTSPELPVVLDFMQDDIPVPGLGTTSTSDPHLLGEVPAFVHATLRCVTAQHGYVLNDEIDLSHTFVTIGGDDDQIVPLQVSYNATHIHITRNASQGSGDSGIQIMVFSSGAYATLTDSSWRIKVYARKKQPAP
jgi:hypothetical protein